MGITFLLDEPFYTGSGNPTDAYALYDVTLNGRPYMIDMESKFGIDQTFNHQTIALIRNQADQQSSPSEASINPEDLWRRSQDTWHHGADQKYLDRADSDPARFDTSKGVDVWTTWQLSLLKDTTRKATTVATLPIVLAAGPALYFAEGSALRFTTDLTSDTPVWFDVPWIVPGEQITSMTTDGHNVWVCQSAMVSQFTTGSAAHPPGTGSYSAPVPQGQVVRYVKGRLMVAGANSIYNITDITASPAALYTHPNPDFQWVDFSEGQSVLYAAGYSGDKSVIYKTGILPDGTALLIPTVAGELPDGEIVRSMQGYLGFQVIGTDKGVRFADTDASGNLIVGSLIPTGSPVLCFEPQDRFVWYGLTNYDSVSSGLGRLDLSVLPSPSTPAYASDLMATTQGTVTSVATFQNRRVFTVASDGLYMETTAPVASGTLESGQITYRLPDKKVAMYVDVHQDGLAAHSMAIATDGGPFIDLGQRSNPDVPFIVNEKRGARFDLRVTLTSVSAVSPIVRSYTLRSYPTAVTILEITAPLLLHEVLKLHDQAEGYMDPGLELAAITDLRTSKTVVPYQEGDTTYQVVLDDYVWRPAKLTADSKAWNGTCSVRLKSITP